jgi:hypothetical protein
MFNAQLSLLNVQGKETRHKFQEFCKIEKHSNYGVLFYF